MSKFNILSLACQYVGYTRLTSPNKPANIKRQPGLEKQNLLASRLLKSGCKLVTITLC